MTFSLKHFLLGDDGRLITWIQPPIKILAGLPGKGTPPKPAAKGVVGIPNGLIPVRIVKGEGRKVVDFLFANLILSSDRWKKSLIKCKHDAFRCFHANHLHVHFVFRCIWKIQNIIHAKNEKYHNNQY